MKLKENAGVTLIELLVAVFISSLFFLALIVIFVNAHKGMLNAYKNNILKNKVTYAIEHIKNNLASASVIDINKTDFGTCDKTAASDSYFYNEFLFSAYNVDIDEGCYPLNSAYSSKVFAYCVTDKSGDGYKELYYYEKVLPSNPLAACPIEDDSNKFDFDDYFPSLQCGENSASTPSVPAQLILDGLTSGFFRISECHPDEVRAVLKVNYPGSIKSKPIDYKVVGDFKVGMSAQNL